MVVSSVPCDHETEDTLQSYGRDRDSSHIPIRAERPTSDSHAPPPGRNETVRPRGGARSRPLGAHAARVVERARERDAVAKTHFQSNLSGWMGWYVVISHCHTISYETNAFLLQYALNRLNIPLILAGNTNVTLDLAVTVLKNFDLKRDTIQTENDVPAR